MTRSSLLALGLALLAPAAISCKDGAKNTGASAGSGANGPARTDPTIEPSPAPDASTQQPAALPGLGRVDAAAFERINTDYLALRALMTVGADDDRDPTTAEVLAFKRVSGAVKSYQRFSAMADDAGWGDASTAAWIERAAADARDEIFSIIRLSPQFCVGWGSETPSDWVAAGCLNPAATFIVPVGDTELIDGCASCSGLAEDAIDPCRESKCTLVVEGYFNGNQRPKPSMSDNGPAFEFEVLRARPAVKWSPPTLRLAGGGPPPDGAALEDGPVWGVLWASAFATNQDAGTEAEAMSERLARAGFAGAQVLDSRRIAGLWCCSRAVLIARFAGRAAAEAFATRVKAKKFRDVLVRRLF